MLSILSKKLLFHMLKGNPVTLIQPSNLDVIGSIVLTSSFHLDSFTIVSWVWMVSKEDKRMFVRIKNRDREQNFLPKGIIWGMKDNPLDPAMLAASVLKSKDSFDQAHTTALCHLRWRSSYDLSTSGALAWGKSLRVSAWLDQGFTSFFLRGSDNLEGWGWGGWIKVHCGGWRA